MSVRGMNERIQRLREESLNTQAHVDMERARYFTETYQEYEGEVSIPELRALALKNYFAKKTLYIGDGELIVGKKETALRQRLPFRICAAIQWKIFM